MGQRHRLAIGLWIALALSGGACTNRVGQGQQCVFNDDCESPLVCASARCRIQCRTDRDCAPSELCAPSESPRKRVCVARTQEALCASDGACPAGSVCAGNNCWWRCQRDPDCAVRNAMTCMVEEHLCLTPVTALQQRELAPAELPGVVLDGGTDVPAASDVTAVPDGASPLDASLDGAGGAEAGLADAHAHDADDVATRADATATTDVTSATDVSVATDVSTATDVTPNVDVPPAACSGDQDCFFANASGRCVAGRCALGACNAGFEDCDRSATNGCEASTTSDPRNCGACGRVCNPAPNVATLACVAGACTRVACATGFGDCNRQASDGCEADLRASVAHCGACGAACPDFTRDPMGALGTVCNAGTCGYTMCASGRADCDGDVTNGCEVDLLTSLAHCGACRSACVAGANAAAACEARRCVRTCRAGFGDCDADPANGCERDLQADPDHCGACGRRCGGGEVCAAGMCVAAAFTAGDATEVFAPTTNVRLSSGVHRFASVNIPRGVTVTVEAPGVLEIYARGEVRIEGSIDVSGGAGGNANDAESQSCANGNAGGGETGTNVQGAHGAATNITRGGAGGTGAQGGVGAGGLADHGGRYGGGAGGLPNGVGAGGGGGGWAGGGGGGGAVGCTFCSGGPGGGTMGRETGGSGGNGGSGAEGGRAGATLETYNGAAGTGAPFDSGGAGGGGGGCIGGTAAADPSVVRDTFRPGSGGGGGGAPRALTNGVCDASRAFGGGGGGGGGGALRLASATRILVGATGVLRADGGDGGSNVERGVVRSGSGGGGSGGVIHLWAPSVQTQGRVSAAGGIGGASAVPTNRGGAGGIGRVAVSVTTPRCALGGSFTPQLLDGCGLSASPGRVGVRTFP
ncbi:MAG: Dickkopf N-terminal cysteine-rich domain-containing protein [Polyangiales bacterium]